MIALIRRWFSKPIPTKDPWDFTSGNGATEWNTGHYCPTCLAWVGSDERIASLCRTCGEKLPKSYLVPERHAREIYMIDKWVAQFRYDEYFTLGLNGEKLPLKKDF